MIALGLGSRSGHPAIPTFLARHAGDALWTVAVYSALAWWRPRAGARVLLAGSLAISFAVEASQLLSAPWLDGWRRSVLGRLLLGQGWQTIDLARYTAGGALAWSIDCVGALGRKRRAPEGCSGA